MGLFDYMFNGYQDDPRASGGLFDGMFASRWAPVDQSSVADYYGGWPGLQPGGSQVASPARPPQNSVGQTMAYSDPPAPQFPIQPPGGQPPRAPTPGYYGGSPASNPLLAPQDPQNAPPPVQRQPMPQGGPQMGQPSAPGMGDRFSAGLQGAQGSFFGGGGPIGALVNLLGGLTTGKRTDPQGVANEEALRMYRFLQTPAGGGLSPTQAQSVIMHPELGKEYYKRMTEGMLPQYDQGNTPGYASRFNKITGQYDVQMPLPKYENVPEGTTPGVLTLPMPGVPRPQAPGSPGSALSGPARTGSALPAAAPAPGGSFTPLMQSQPKFSDVRGLQDAAGNLPEVKRYSEAVPHFNSMIKSKDINTRATDLAFVYGLAKIYDPTSVVREGEMVMVNKTQGLPDQLIGYINKLNAGGQLQPEARKQLLVAANNIMGEYRHGADLRLGPYKKLAGRSQINIDEVMPALPDINAIPGVKPPDNAVQVQVPGYSGRVFMGR